MEERQELLKDVLSFFPDKELARRHFKRASIETLKRILDSENNRQDNEAIEQSFEY